MTSETNVLPLFAGEGKYNVTKKTTDADTGNILSLETVVVDQDWFDRLCDKDPEHFFIAGSSGEEEAFWLREI